MAIRLATFSSCLLSICILLCTGIQTAVGNVEKGTRWQDAVVTELDVDFGGSGFHARWSFHRCDCGDLLIRLEQVAPDDILSGEIILVGGRVLLARGFEQQDSEIESLVQAPVLMLQLAYAMLDRSQPAGPGTVGEKQHWDNTEQKQDFILNTGLATGAFAAPWRVKGSSWQTGSGSHRFELLFQFNVAQPGQPVKNESITFSGNLDYKKQPFPYPESTDLQGWIIQWISRNEAVSTPLTESLTLEQLRQQLTNP